jgi:hypothetical protein
MDHTFVIPVHGAAPRLGALIESLRGQLEIYSDVRLTTSTPSEELHACSKLYGVPLHINPQRIDIAADWNFAFRVAETPLVTLAHQDDLFDKAYAARLASALRRNHGALLAFCDYAEHTSQGPRPMNINLRIKRTLRRRAFGKSECIVEPHRKIRLLSFGNPICCPSVMFDRSALGDFRFPQGFQTNLDWMAWLELAYRRGGFVYTRECLVSKGIHPNSETTITIANRARQREDRILFGALWPRPIAAMLAGIYRLSYRSNRL